MNKIYRETGEDALSGVQARSWPAPAREEMLTQVYLRATTKEDRMSVFDRLFAGRPLAAKIGLAGAMLVLLLVAAVLLPRPGYSPALAATEGVVLNYDLSAFEKEQARAKLHELEAAISANLPKGVELLTANLRAEVRREKRAIKHDGVQQGAPQETETTKISGVIVLSSADDALITKLTDAVAQAVPGVSKPEVHDATWFRENGGGPDNGGISITLGINGDQHIFNFPKGTDAEQIKREIKAWVEEKHPGMEFDVDANISSNGASEQQVEVRIEGRSDEEEK